MPASPSLRSALGARSSAVRTGPRGIRLGLAAVLFASLLAAFAPAAGANAAPPPAPAGLEAVVGCVTADGTGGEPTTVYVDPSWLATVPDGSVITLHGSRADELNFFDAASGTWTGRPIDASSIGVPQCTGVKSGDTITDPHWAYCFNHNLNVCRTSVYQSVASLPVNRQVGTETPAFTNDTSPLTAERYAQLNWLAMHSGTGGPTDREHLAFAIWCIANQIPDGASPGFEPYNGAYVPRTGGGKTTWDHCPIDLSQTKTPTNVFTNDGADRALSPAWKRLAANGDPSSPLNNNWAAVSLEQAAAGAPSVAIAGPSAPVAPGAPIPFTITLSTDQVNLDVPAGQRATLCADDTSGAVVEGRYLYFPNSGTENTARVCLDGQPTGSRATLGVSLVFLKPDAPSLSSGDPNCQGLIQMAETRLTADAIVEAPAVGSVKLHKHDRTDSAIPLAGAVFELRDADGATVATLTTDASGDASATGLAPGVYRLVETSAPSGYVLDPTVREVQVPGAGEASVDVANTRATPVAPENPATVPPVPAMDGPERPGTLTRPPLAETGMHAAGIAVPALVLLLAGAGLLIGLCRRRWTTRQDGSDETRC